MDDYMFLSYVTGCHYVPENTTYLEIFNYTVSLSFPALSPSASHANVSWRIEAVLNKLIAFLNAALFLSCAVSPLTSSSALSSLGKLTGRRMILGSPL